MAIVGWFKKLSLLKKILVLFALLIMLSAIFGNENNTNVNDTQKEYKVNEINSPSEQSEIKNISYNQLQFLYLDINENMGYNEVLDAVKNTTLPYSDVKYSDGRTIKVALDDKVTPQLYADSGDYVSIHFDQHKDDDNEYVFSVMEYFNDTAFIKVFQYEKGIYWDFRESTDEYKGLYINDHKSENEFEINYDNGNNVTVNWIHVKTKEEQFEYIFNHLD